MDIPIRVSGQKIYMQKNHYRLSPGTQDFIKFIFDLSEDWDGLRIFAQFTQGGEPYSYYLDANDTVNFPPEIVTGECTMMLYGSDGNGRTGTTGVIRLYIDDNHFIADGQSTIITQSLYDQLVSEVSKYIPFEQVATVNEVQNSLR